MAGRKTSQNKTIISDMSQGRVVNDGILKSWIKRWKLLAWKIKGLYFLTECHVSTTSNISASITFHLFTTRYVYWQEYNAGKFRRTAVSTTKSSRIIVASWSTSFFFQSYDCFVRFPTLCSMWGLSSCGWKIEAYKKHGLEYSYLCQTILLVWFYKFKLPVKRYVAQLHK